jgi:hypothetical protein
LKKKNNNKKQQATRGAEQQARKRRALFAPDTSQRIVISGQEDGRYIETHSVCVAPYGFFSPNWIEHKNITKSLRAKKQGRQTMSSPECHKGNERKKKQKQKK